jgi:hypothetical protein
MMQVDHLFITSAKIRPRLGYGNAPDLELRSTEPLIGDELYNYDMNERVYWCQLKDGFTSFYYCGPPTFVEGKWRTKNAGGYSGRVFPLKVLWNNEVVNVDVTGPWSGGCYIANRVLPKPAKEVNVNNCHGINLTLERIRIIIDEFNLENWTVDLNGTLGEFSPEFRYRGLMKKYWTPTIKEELRDMNLDDYNRDVQKRLGV